jgi:uncharacterized membrane protein YczE
MAEVDLFFNATSAHITLMKIARRFVQLQLGLMLYGVSLALMVRANLGLDPWDVFHEGVADQSGASFGLVVNLVGAAVLLLWIPLRQWPGLGTVCNVLVIGTTTDLALSIMAAPDGLFLRGAFLAMGIGLNAVATAAYIGAGFGPGPRDGLMTGLVRRTGWPVKWTRMGIEVTVLGIGWLLGGTVGLGTVLYAIAIGPLVQPLLPIFATAPKREPSPAPAPALAAPNSASRQHKGVEVETISKQPSAG